MASTTGIMRSCSQSQRVFVKKPVQLNLYPKAISASIPANDAIEAATTRGFLTFCHLERDFGIIAPPLMLYSVFELEFEDNLLRFGRMAKMGQISACSAMRTTVITRSRRYLLLGFSHKLSILSHI